VNILNKKHQFLLIFTLLTLSSTLDVVLAKTSTWLVSEKTTYEFEIEKHSFGLGFAMNIEGALVLTIEEIQSDGTMIYSIDYDTALESNSYYSFIEDDESLSASGIVVDDLANTLICTEEIYNLLDYSGLYDVLTGLVEEMNNEGANIAISGFSSNKSYDITLNGTDQEGGLYESRSKGILNSAGVFEELLLNSSMVVSGIPIISYSSLKLENSGPISNSIPGQSLGFLSISMVIGIVALFVSRKRSI
jgi:hypothetical protein